MATRFAGALLGSIYWQYIDCLKKHASITVVPIEVATRVTPDMAPEGTTA